jgi:hypothetical protein
MIVFDLKCSRRHVFEAWFQSTEAYGEQRGRGLIACPLCDCAEIEKAVMAPAVPAKGNRRTEVAMAGGDPGLKAKLAELAALQAEIERGCDDVGERFADEARARHARGGGGRGIFGETSLETARDLLDEGIAIAPLPFRPRRRADA